jgi:diadenosine tetraphosphate (Ap4A) HIT family hydrolase
MPPQNCIFCKILSQEIPSTIIAQNELVIAIKDIAPKAPVHYLIIPKKHIRDIQSLEKEDASYAAAMLLMAQELSMQLPQGGAVKLVMNNGAQAGQSVFHLHCHFLSGKVMLEL